MLSRSYIIIIFEYSDFIEEITWESKVAAYLGSGT